jgi:3-oxoacyl-[acyl-carrier-protein] synthase II
MKKRVVITGIGVLTPCGIGKQELWNSVINGISYAEVSDVLKCSDIHVKIANELKGFNPENYLNPRTIMRLDRQGVLSFCAAKIAIEDSDLKITESESPKTGIFEGTALSSLNTNFERHSLYIKNGLKKISPMALLNGLTGNASGMIALEYSIHGPAITFSNGCVSSSYAIGYGFKKIQTGELEIAIAGGAEAPVSIEIIGLFAKAGLLSVNNENPGDACKPFDRYRDGFVLGEGGAFLILEELERALMRHAKIYAELKGFGESTDAYHGSSPHPKGIYYANAMKCALVDAGIEPEEIEYVNVHGTATKWNDPSESRAIKSLFKSYSERLPVSSTKQITGHLLGACGSLELAITCLAIMNGQIPHIANLKDKDPECGINVIRSPIKKKINYAMSNNLSFGGRNSSLIIKRFLN